jgi:hypothetical protein
MGEELLGRAVCCFRFATGVVWDGVANRGVFVAVNAKAVAGSVFFGSASALSGITTDPLEFVSLDDAESRFGRNSISIATPTSATLPNAMTFRCRGCLAITKVLSVLSMVPMFMNASAILARAAKVAWLEMIHAMLQQSSCRTGG